MEGHPHLELPTAILLKLLNSKDRDVILHNARIWPEPLRIDNTKVSFFRDFSAELQKQTAKLTDVKRLLRNLDLKYAMLYPANVQVEALGITDSRQFTNIIPYH